MNKFIYIILCISAINSFAQTDTTKAYCVPALKGVPIGKGLSIEYQNVSGYSLKTTDKTGDFLDAESAMRSNTNLEIKLKVPVVNKDHINILLGLKYTKEEFHFSQPAKHPFYQNLEDRGLTSMGVNATIIKPTRSKKFWILKANADLNGDYGAIHSISDYLKFSISPALGLKVNENFSYALGASFNYRFGSPLVIPVAAFNININEKWGLDAILPVFIRSRYQYNQNLIWQNSIEIDGASYKIANFNDEFNAFSKLHLHRSDIKITTRIEKKLIGWLWAASEIGLRENLIFNLNNSVQSKTNIIFKNELSTAFLFNVSLFLSPR